ncbi:isopenicillin N synthase family oxygenase [Marinomonas transparens]|uniref:2-oxoglutarate-dependent ethylene/succinate-forming enzyme n=1 Tax=Marinomonas transparens TaxID=2795388 RepID=A0A934JYT6_9GAMM|nr:isopenicillin N synthase family oxygenase [Marinomonas transparens]MBJ7539427.1 isopenicillin N synthase family oxygenase [Marinomonas transparens]
MQLQAIDYTSPTAQQDFVKSLHETGFGVLKNHPIQKSLVSAIYNEWQRFFDSDTKHDYRYNIGPQDGYFAPEASETAKGHSKRDIKEYFHYYPWGQCPEQEKKLLSQYYSEASTLAKELLAWVEKHTPSDIAQHYSQSLSSMVDGSEQTLLRVLHYPPLKGDEELGAIRAGAHEDINLLTILPSANEPGLQVKAKDGSWMDVPCDFGTLIINIGDMLQEASGGYFPSTSHRVINPEGADKTKSRISLPLFLHPKPEVVLSERHTAKSYLHERLVELGVIPA